MRKKVLSLFLALLMATLTCVPAFAVEENHAYIDTVTLTENGARSGGVVTTKNKPSIPSGFYTTPYAVINSNIMVDVLASITSSGATAYIFAPITGTGLFYAGVVGAAIAGLAALGGGTLPAGAVEYIYEAQNPVADFQVPYVFWHEIEYTVDTEDEGPVVFYNSFYEYAVMPRSIPN